MRFLLSIVCLLSASITAGHCLVCLECFNQTGSSCVGSLVTCASCLTIVTYKDYADNSTSSMIAKSCSLNPEICNISYSLTVGTVHTAFTSSCCYTDYCNNDTIQAPPKNTTENGVVCPSCFLPDADSCEANDTKKCGGPEIKCINFSGKVYDTDAFNQYAFQGCVTDNVCNAKSIPLYPITQLSEGYRLQCSEGNHTSQDL
ncbi:hypothetical protein FKM82_012992 [Ascaphus truei]